MNYEWWQLFLLLIAGGWSLGYIQKQAQPNLPGLKALVQTLFREIRLSTASARGQIVNLVFGLAAAILTFAFYAPSILIQVGILQDGESHDPLIGLVLTLAFFGCSGYFIYRFEQALRAYSDNEPAEADDKVGD